MVVWWTFVGNSGNVGGGEMLETWLTFDAAGIAAFLEKIVIFWYFAMR